MSGTLLNEVQRLSQYEVLDDNVMTYFFQVVMQEFRIYPTGVQLAIIRIVTDLARIYRSQGMYEIRNLLGWLIPLLDGSCGILPEASDDVIQVHLDIFQVLIEECLHID